MSDFAVCPHGPCAPALASKEKELQQLRGRIEDLMRRCREERHQVDYMDLLLVLHGDGGAR